jgi:membrane protease YdiL (CAAX protease family)
MRGSAVDDEVAKEILLNLLGYLAAGAAGIAVAAGLLVALPNIRRRLLPVPHLRPGHWTGPEVVLVFLTLPFAQLGVAILLLPLFAEAPAGDLEASKIANVRHGILGSPLWIALTLAIVTSLLFAISRTRPHAYGVTWARWPANVVVGVLAFLAVTPIALAINFLVSPLAAAKHPFELLVSKDFQGWEWAILVFMTTIGAPATEEILFRGVLQGWLRRASLVGHGVLLTVVLVTGATPLVLHFAAEFAEGPLQAVLRAIAPADARQAILSLASSGLLAAGYAGWLSMRWKRFPTPVKNLQPVDPISAALADDGSEPVEDEAESRSPPPAWDPRQREWAWANAGLPIYGSAMLWALEHGWPQSIPLFLLGLGLGWLAYRTQSLIGPMVCHSLFNMVACFVLFEGRGGG